MDFHGAAKTQPSILKVRCPQCLKMYSIHAEKISEPKPEFACTSCQTRFWIPFPEALDLGEIIGFSSSWIDKKEKASMAEEKMPCEVCGGHNPKAAKKCDHCGIEFLDMKARNEELKEGFQVSKELRGLWRKVIDQFESQDLHKSFIETCQAQGALDYAVYRYSRVLKACPEDEISAEMLQRIDKKINARMVTEATPAPRGQKKVLGFTSPFTSSMILIGVVLVIGGYFLPTFRNMVGIGAALIFLAIAIRSTLSGPRS